MAHNQDVVNRLRTCFLQLIKEFFEGFQEDKSPGIDVQSTLTPFGSETFVGNVLGVCFLFPSVTGGALVNSSSTGSQERRQQGFFIGYFEVQILLYY